MIVLMHPARPFHGVLVVLITTVLVIAGQTTSQELNDLVGDGGDLDAAISFIREGDRLARDRKYDAALEEYVKAYQIIVPSVRKKPFRQPLAVSFERRGELQQKVQDELEKIGAPALEHTETLYRAMGYIEADYHLRSGLAKLLSGKIAGYYDTNTKELKLILEDEKRGGLFSRLLFKNTFDAEGQKLTLAHEMTHALSDQHFYLDDFGEGINYQDDYQLAVTALIEGEAMLVTFAELIEDRTGTAMQYVDVDTLAGTLRAMDWLERTFTPSLRKYPAVLRDSLYFPYTEGALFVATLFAGRGWADVDQAFSAPPVSTEQVLHPERFARKRDDPQWIELPELERLVKSAGWSSVGENTLGEFYIRVLFDVWASRHEIAEGWDGDRCEVFRRGENDLALAWYTTWDSLKDARQFAVAACQWFDALLTHRAAGQPGAVRPEPGRMQELEAWWNSPDSHRWERIESGRTLAVARQRRDVVVVYGFEPSQNRLIEQHLWRSQKAPWRLVRVVESAPDEAHE
ncbi:MAG: hypothetical protein KatS3mg109_0990 [Pirellulaceae bacterium]|nr:MAG: hypothetical protein KatS3mg109_0990 [Pirellulaceae bacterium]